MQQQQSQVPNNSTEKQEQLENEYGSVQYWQSRYKKSKGQRFDWLESHVPILEIMVAEMGSSLSLSLLNIGCGNGSIQDDLYNLGYHKIHNNDISKQVISQLQQIKAQKQQHEMIYEVMDVRKMSYLDEMFDVVIDKSTIDALLCGRNPYIDTAMMFAEVWRVLRYGGLYLVVSYAGAESRMKHFLRGHVCFDVKLKELTRVNEDGNKLTHYAYICRKRNKSLEAQSPEWLKLFYKNLRKQEQNDYGDI